MSESGFRRQLRSLIDTDKVFDALDDFEDWNARQSRWLRLPLGILLCLGGVFSILPVLGLWMLPLGLLILSEDIPWLRERRERVEGWLERLLGNRRHKRQLRLERRRERSG